MPLDIFDIDEFGNYFNTFEIPIYKKPKSKKALKTIQNQKHKQFIMKSRSHLPKIIIDKTKQIKKEKIIISTYKEVIEMDKKNYLIILNFVYNLGKAEIKEFQNYCEINYRINREDNPIILRTVLHKNEVLEVLDYLQTKRRK